MFSTVCWKCCWIIVECVEISKFWYKWQNYDTRTFVRHRNTLVFTTNTLNQTITDSKTKRLYHFRLLFGLLVTVNNSTCVQCSLLLQNAFRKIRLAAVGGKFTFTICSHFHRTGIVVPHNSHVTKSTRYHLTTQNTQKSFDTPLRVKPNYSLPKLTLKICSKIQQNKLSPHPLSLTISTPSKT